MERNCSTESQFFPLTLLHSERSKFHRVLAFLSAIGLRVDNILEGCVTQGNQQEIAKVVSLVQMVEKH